MERAIAVEPHTSSKDEAMRGMRAEERDADSSCDPLRRAKYEATVFAEVMRAMGLEL